MSEETKELNHLLIIIDGNRRYAKKKGITYLDSYKESVDRICDAIQLFSIDERIPVVSFYAVAYYNFDRSPEEVAPICDAVGYAMGRFAELSDFVEYNVCGNLKRFPPELAMKVGSIENPEIAQAPLVNLLIGYSGDQDRIKAINACLVNRQEPTDRNLLQHSSLGDCPIDLILRTGGVVRLSDGPLMGIKQSRMYPIDKLFAEATKDDWLNAIDDFRKGRKL